MRKLFCLAFGIATALAACGAALPSLPPDAAIMPEAVADQLLHQCSRAVPSAYDGHWVPGAGDIAALEAALPAALPREPALRGAPAGWQRQYAGFLRGGRRFIYGNFVPHRPGEANSWSRDWRSAPVMVCDGGHVFFGVEYDVGAHRITHLAFNGFA